MDEIFHLLPHRALQSIQKCVDFHELQSTSSLPDDVVGDGEDEVDGDDDGKVDGEVIDNQIQSAYDQGTLKRRKVTEKKTCVEDISKLERFHWLSRGSKDSTLDSKTSVVTSDSISFRTILLDAVDNYNHHRLEKNLPIM